MIKADKYFKENLELLIKDFSKDENPRAKYADGTPAYCYYITHIFETYDLQKGEFPIPTYRKTAIKTGIKEILWIYQKQTSDLSVAHELGINWWDNWDIGGGTIGQRYGATVKSYQLINKLLYNLTFDPFSKRHVMELWQESDLRTTKGLFPCAHLTEWSVRRGAFNDLYLDCLLVQRSSDYLVASAINKAQYVALQMMIASSLGYKVGKFSWMCNNLHIYDRHVPALNELFVKQPLDHQPTMSLKTDKDFFSIGIEDFEFTGLEGITHIESPLELAI